MGYTLIQNLTTVNRTVGRTDSIKYIVIHYTGNNTDTAANNGNYFKSVNKGASAHYFVDKKQVVQVVLDADTAWAVGKNFGDASKNLFNTVKNYNSISIEMCSDNGAIAEETFNNTVELTKKLMAKYNISADHVYRHYDVCSKQCPGWKGWIDSNPTHWNRFKAAISGKAVVAENTAKPVTAAPTTSKANNHLKDLQGALNDDYKAGLVKDGLYGPKTEVALNKVALSTNTIRKYTNVTAWVQCRIGTKPDGLFGNGTKDAVKTYQKKKGLTADGIVGAKTMKAILKDMGVNC